ncbi:MAG TPA: hypothetical protein VFZ61_14980 [Polyangiales bacterium]
MPNISGVALSRAARTTQACVLWLSLASACGGDALRPHDASVAEDASDADAQIANSDAADSAPLGDAASEEPACDSPSARLGVDYFERFGDGLDSNCDGEDDPAFHEKPCSCDWLDPTDAPSVGRCGDGFNPRDAQHALATASLDPGSCPLADLKIAFAVQCTSDCFGVPIYVSVANVGGARSGPARIALVGSFRHGRPNGSLEIEPLEPGQVTPLMDITATGDYRIEVETDEEECERGNNSVAVDA